MIHRTLELGRYNELVEKSYAEGSALNIASFSKSKPSPIQKTRTTGSQGYCSPRWKVLERMARF